MMCLYVILISTFKDHAYTCRGGQSIKIVLSTLSVKLYSKREGFSHPEVFLFCIDSFSKEVWLTRKQTSSHKNCVSQEKNVENLPSVSIFQNVSERVTARLYNILWGIRYQNKEFRLDIELKKHFIFSFEKRQVEKWMIFL